MAEERLIDDDIEKDKKYSFRINEDGEEELVIVQEEPAPVPALEEQPQGEDERFDAVEEERVVGDILARAREEMVNNRYSTALEFLSQAKEILPRDGEIAALELYAYTRGFTEYSQGALPDAAAAARDVAAYCTPEQKKNLGERGAEELKGMISSLQREVEELDRRNEEGKAARAVRFDADNKKSLIFFFPAVALFIASLAAAIYFAVGIEGDRTDTFVIYTLVFTAVTLALFVVCLVAGRALSITARRVRMNKDNSCTQLGREYVAANTRLNHLRTIYDAVTK